MHLAGIEFAYNHWLDAHCRGIDPELVSIATETIATLPNLGAIIFEIAPDRVASFGAKAFLREMETLHRLWELMPAAATAVAKPAAQPSIELFDAPNPEAWERLIAQQLLIPDERPEDSGEDAHVRRIDEESFALYLRLVSSFRAGTIAEMLANTTRLLLMAIGEQALCFGRSRERPRKTIACS